MHWIDDYQLFLFDFDGLLVNTEEIHFKAYQYMCKKYGFNLDWSFARYCQAAHYHAEGLKEEIYRELPALYEVEPNWDVLYACKREKVIELLHQDIQLMPGVQELLEALNKANIKRCVVTHSPQALVDTVRCQLPILNTIPYWFTREFYTHPKPHPESYLTAIKQLADYQDNIIGFEDTPRGIKALLQTSAQPVLVSKAAYDNLPSNVIRVVDFNVLNNSQKLESLGF
ncbi:HAD family phosphatase [Neochlamydia sp. S13]|uniref:HAD family hydrolase n=1 Tax=Neochlamydia sp. S13 TaxID=1353976 RepID=UPI0006940A20|nr:HAD family phosphatase [Neochlamydia sp. S13]BBI18114.1 Putative uncharacterized protein [Neochlamydia sp. S13]